MILVGQYDSFPTRRVAMVLHHYGLAFTRDTRSIFGDADGIGRINPLIRIPALILDDGERLIDSVAIVDALDEMVGPSRALVPRDGPARRRILQATALAQGIGEKASHVVYERHFHPPAHLCRAWEERSLGQTAAGLAELEARVEGPWLCGAELCHADFMAACVVGYLRLRLPEALPAGVYPTLEALSARAEALPAARAAAIGADERMP